MEEVKRVAINISEITLGQDQKIDVAVGNVKEIRIKMQDARTALNETNNYQQDTNKMKILFCGLLSVVVLVIIMIIIAAKK